MGDWLEGNNHYLSASLHWLRLLLERLAPEDSLSPVSAAIEVVEEIRSRRPRWLGGRSTPPRKVPLLASPSCVPLDEQIEAAAKARAEAAAIDPPPALFLLAERLGLSEFERDTLLMCAAMDYDPHFATLCARANGAANHNYPTFGLALSIFKEPSWDAVAPHRPLRYARLIEINQPGAVALTSSPLRADERIVNFIKGLNVLDDRLATLVDTVGAGDAADLAPSQQATVETILQHLRQAALDSLLPVTQLVGADLGSRLAVAHQVSEALSRRLYRIDLHALPAQVAEVETFTRLWQRETLLLPVALYIDAENLDAASAETSSAIQHMLSRELGLLFIGVRETPLTLRHASFSVDVRKPTSAEQAAAWAALLGGDADEEINETAEALAGQFNLSLSDIRHAAAQALQAAPAGTALREGAWAACRDLTRPRLDSLAQRLDPKATWDDLVLLDEQMRVMRQIAGQVRERHKVYEAWGFARKMNRGFGISALFTGESGTGKTMAAEVIANDLKLNLYRIDLSAVVSKYIGETEKNLRRVFDAAEQGGAILFFDEADALFGKRSEVRDSHDRYANIEINYLLQRMEAFSGLAILATNMKNALDTAFMRRLRFMVNFQFPGLKERKLIWQKVLPQQTPRENLDYDRLARLNLTGGNIHSIALNAAFMAAQEDKPVSMQTLLAATRMEMRKMEKPFNESEFK